MEGVLPRKIALFPLPKVVLFPGSLLPLHIFEPRYRRLFADLDEDVSLGGLVGIVCLRGAEGSPAPDVFAVGCAGAVVRSAPLPDGRSNVLLRGAGAFEIESESFDRPYRMGTVRWLDDDVPGFALETAERTRLLSLARSLSSVDPRALSVLASQAETDADLVNRLSFALPLEAIERQALLESRPIARRAVRLLDALEIRLAEGRMRRGAPRSWSH